MRGEAIEVSWSAGNGGSENTLSKEKARKVTVCRKKKGKNLNSYRWDVNKNHGSYGAQNGAF